MGGGEEGAVTMSKCMLWCAPHRKQDLPRHSLLHRLCYLPCERLMDLLCLPCPGSSSCFVNWLLRIRVQDIVLAQHLPSVKQTNKQPYLSCVHVSGGQRTISWSLFSPRGSPGMGLGSHGTWQIPPACQTLGSYFLYMLTHCSLLGR